MKPRLVCITGQTASGKSGLAMELCRRLGAEILSVDSMQVYRGFDIGTAKPTAAEQAAVPHHGIDLVDPTEVFSASAFLAYARDLLERAAAEGRTVLAVGGTGLYLRALLHGMGAMPGRDDALRAELRAEEAAAAGAMHRRLQALDPEAARRLHPNDLIRVERALEVVIQSGVPISRWQADHGFAEAPFDTLVCAIRWDRPVLRERIAVRVDAMLEAGWVDEVRGLLAAGVARDCIPMRAIGYPRILQMLDGALPPADLAGRITTDCRRFAKRQATWFNRAPSLRWLPGPASADAVVGDIEAFLARAPVR